MKLSDDIHLFWKFWSVRFGLLAFACCSAGFAYAKLPEDWLPHIPNLLKQSLGVGATVFTFLSVVSRGIDQPKLRQDSDT